MFSLDGNLIYFSKPKNRVQNVSGGGYMFWCKQLNVYWYVIFDCLFDSCDI